MKEEEDRRAQGGFDRPAVGDEERTHLSYAAKFYGTAERKIAHYHKRQNDLVGGQAKQKGK